MGESSRSSHAAMRPFCVSRHASSPGAWGQWAYTKPTSTGAYCRSPRINVVPHVGASPRASCRARHGLDVVDGAGFEAGQVVNQSDESTCDGAIIVSDLVSVGSSLLNTWELSARSTVRARVQGWTGIKRVLTRPMNLDNALWMSSSLDPDVVRARQELQSLAERLLVIRDTARREELRTRTKRIVEHLRLRRPPHARA